jgi:hypothetical protein
MKFAPPESVDKALTQKIWYVRTTSARFGFAEYAKAVVDFENPETAKLNILVSKMPFIDMVPFYIDRPIKTNPNIHPRLLQASTVYEKMDKVTKVAVEVFLPCPLSQSHSMYGVSELCRKAFPSIDIETSSVHVTYGQNRWSFNGAFRPQTVATVSLSPATLPIPLNAQRDSA